MTYLGIALIVAANCVVLFFASFLAAGGDGNASGVKTVWLFGYSCIGVLALISLALCFRGRRLLAVLTVAGSLPIAFFAGSLVVLGDMLVAHLAPSSPVLVEACKTAGAKFIAAPAAPVQSIASDWEDKYAPQYSYFEFDRVGRVSSLQGGLPRFPAPIKFSEGRCCRYEGPPTNMVGPFVRHPNGADYYGITALTADALVTYRSSKLGETSDVSDLRQIDLEVTDRRDGKTLATLRYFLDSRMRRGCASPTEGAMDEQAFILRAVGIK